MTEPTAPLHPVEPLWRHVLGARLRRLRLDRGETLIETARRAGVSPQYLSEIERGIKEPSSEMIAAVAGALDVTLVELTAAVAENLRGAQQRRHLRSVTSTAGPRVATAASRRVGGAYLLAA